MKPVELPPWPLGVAKLPLDRPYRGRWTILMAIMGGLAIPNGQKKRKKIIKGLRIGGGRIIHVDFGVG
jgi:hypothetical protein